MVNKRVLSFSLALAFVVISVLGYDGSFETDANQVKQLNYVEQKVA